MKPLFLAGLGLFLGMASAHAESRTVLIRAMQDKNKKTAVTIDSDEKKERKTAVAVDEAIQVIAKMEGWGSLIGVYVATERGIPSVDRRKLLAAISGNPWLDLEYLGPDIPKGVVDHFLGKDQP